MDGCMNCTSYLGFVFENGDEVHFEWKHVTDFLLARTQHDVIKIGSELHEVHTCEECEIVLEPDGNSEFRHFGEVHSGLSTYDYIAQTRDITQIVVNTCDDSITYFIPEEAELHCYRDNGNLIVKFG